MKPVSNPQYPNNPGPHQGGPGGPGPGGPGGPGPQQPYGPPQGGGYPPAGPGGPGGPQQPSYGPPGGGQQYGPAGGQPPPGGGGPQGPGGPGGGSGWQGGGPFAEPPEARSGGRRTGLIVGLAVALVLVVAGGAFAVTRFLGTSSGTQPAEALPADAVAYLRVDLNPTGDQKLKAYNFLKKFPAVADKLGSENEDLRKQLFEMAKESDPELKKLDYAKDVEPWLGDRLGVATLPGAEGSSQGKSVLALEVKDQAAAEEGIKKLSDGEDVGMAFVGNYAVLAESEKDAEKYAEAAQKEPLSGNEQFASDTESLGDPGFASFWVDGKAASQFAGPSAGMGGVPEVQGRVVGALKFDDRFAEFSGSVRGGPELPTKGAKSQVATLPDSTVAAFSMGGLGPMLQSAWPQIQKGVQSSGQGAEFDSFVRMAEQQLQLKLPDDLAALLGDDTSIALDGEGLSESLQSGGIPNLGVRFTADVDKAQPVLDKVLGIAQQAMSQSGQSFQLGKAVGDGKLSVASTQEYADTLVKGGNLGSQEAFELAVPDPEAQGALFVDIDKLEPLFLGTMSAEDKKNIEPLQAVGVSGGVGDDGNGTFTMRLVVN